MSIDDASNTLEIAQNLGEILASRIKATLLLASKGQEPSFSEIRLNYLSGYVTAYSDVLAQHAGGESGGSLAVSITARALQNLFGAEAGQRVFGIVDRYMAISNRPGEFDDGLSDGADDANEQLEQGSRYGVCQNLASFFLEVA